MFDVEKLCCYILTLLVTVTGAPVSPRENVITTIGHHDDDEDGTDGMDVASVCATAADQRL